MNPLIRPLLYRSDLAKAFRKEMKTARHVSIAVALIRWKGLELISKQISTHLHNGNTVDILIGFDLPTEPEAVDRLLKLQTEHPKHMRVRRFQSGTMGVFHPKFMVFDHAKGHSSAIIGSSNLTDAGWELNNEANLWLREPSTVEALQSYFTELFLGGYARKISDTWMADYRRIWKRRIKLREQQLAIRRKAQQIKAQKTAGPSRIRGYRFAFTGGIAGHPRKSLYPRVRRLGGTVVTSARGVPSADCLIHAELGSRETTQKLQYAEQYGIPRITADDFLYLVKKESKKRKRSA